MDTKRLETAEDSGVRPAQRLVRQRELGQLAHETLEHHPPDGPAVLRHHVAPVPPGALVPSLNARNVVDEVAVSRAEREALEGVWRPKRVALVLPDPVARVSIVRFDTVPGRAEDRDRLIRLQVRKSVPFPIEGAQLAVTQGRPLDGPAQEFVVAVARRDIVEEYEALCGKASAHAGTVDLATCSLINVVAAAQKGAMPSDLLVVHVAPDYSTIAASAWACSPAPASARACCSA